MWTLALWLMALWLGALLFQIADLGTAWYDLRSARTRAGQLASRRSHELFWIGPSAVLITLVLGFGALQVARNIGETLPASAGPGGTIAALSVVLTLVVIALIAFGFIIVVVRTLTRDVQSYAVLRFTLVEARSRRLGRDDVAAWREELEAIDSHEAVRHEPIARILRLVPVVLAVATLAAIAWAVIAEGPADWVDLIVVIAAALIPAISVVLAARSARLSLRARASWSLANSKQRTELVATLDELERRTGRGVSGLSDRVNRALQILREQQS